MKLIYSLFIMACLASCGQQNLDSNHSKPVAEKTAMHQDEKKKQELQENVDYMRREALKDYKKGTLYKLTDTISADFNGDGFPDKAVFVKEKEKSGIIIIHGHTNEIVKLGFGKLFDKFEDFNWVDFWGLVEDKETDQTLFSKDSSEVTGTKKVKLQNPSILLNQDESGGGLITFKNGKYIWIHQTC